MTAMQIPCPECSSVLKLPDRSLLGKKGRCPSCRHTFVLAEPEEVELQLADTGDDEAPRQGTSARWVPDESTAEAVPPGGQSTDEAVYGATAGDASPPSTVAGTDGFPVFDDQPATSASRRQRGRRRKKSSDKRETAGGGRRGKRKGPSVAVMAGSAIVVLAIASVAVTMLRPSAGAGEAVGAGETSTQDPLKPAHQQPQAPQDAKGEDGTLSVAGGGTVGASASLRPIRLEMVPAGANIIINMRPSLLWTPESHGEELRFCLGPLGEWVEQQLTSICRFPPEEIEEAMVCLMLGQRGDPPEIAAVVHLKGAQKPSALLEKFPGQRSDDYSYPVYLGEEHCFLRGSDGKTVAIAPLDRAEEMALAVRNPAVTSTGIEQILPLTSRDKLMTVVFEPRDARNFQEVLVSDTVSPVFNLMLDWFDDEEIETVAWSIDVDQQGDQFESEFLLRNHHSHNNIVTPGRLERSLQKRLGSLPVEMMSAVEKMQPKTVGPYRLISRFPAMVSAYVLSTETAVGDRHVQLLTRLPERAASNIALSALLAWDESTRTDFSVAAPKREASGKALPKTVAGRLGVKIEVDFRRTPLQEAMLFIAEEIQVPIDIDGDALKLSGYTKNMPQTLAKQAPASTVLHEIMKKYKDLVIVVDEKTKKITLLTQAVAKKKGLEPFPVDK